MENSVNGGRDRSPPKAVRLLKDGTPLEFEMRGHRLVLTKLPKTPPDKHAGITVIELQFDGPPQYSFASAYPQLHGGREVPGGIQM